MGVLMRRLLESHEKLAEWSPEDPASLDAAREVLQREIEAGYTAVVSGGGDNEPVTELPPDADVVILTMPMGGG
jgi:hypothetical protein